MLPLRKSVCLSSCSVGNRTPSCSACAFASFHDSPTFDAAQSKATCTTPVEISAEPPPAPPNVMPRATQSLMPSPALRPWALIVATKGALVVI